MLDSHTNPISVYRNDPDRWLGFQNCRGTDVNLWSAGLIALFATGLILAGLLFSPESYLRSMVLERGPTQYVAIFLGLWAAVILWIKQRKLKTQRLALKHSIVPNDHSFVLSSQTADIVSKRIHEIAEDPERFIVFNRILIAISSLKNLGRVSDADEILNSIADQDSSAHETSFAILNGFLWAIPVLGFIGTVLGLSSSIGNFSNLLESQSEVSGIISSLREVTGGLSTAFETTLLALVIALIVQLWMTGQKKAEEAFLDDCHDYCIRQVTSKIKILPYEQTREV
jgi:biopolymer transport protein ExbB/TolQ